MASLKGFTDHFAEDLGTTPALIYERQRALVRAKVLKPVKEGKGPGHGVVASPITAAQVLIAAMASTDLASTVERAVEVGDLTRNRKRLADTLAEILASPHEAAKVDFITFCKSLPYVVLAYRRDNSSTETHTYGNKGQFSRTPTRALVEIDGSLIVKMAHHLAENK